jgi:hypothetical protein
LRYEYPVFTFTNMIELFLSYSSVCLYWILEEFKLKNKDRLVTLYDLCLKRKLLQRERENLNRLMELSDVGDVFTTDVPLLCDWLLFLIYG